MSKSKHWWHITLSVSARGLTTTPFPIAGQNLELTLDLVTHGLVIESSNDWSADLPLVEQSAAGLCQGINSILAAKNIELEPSLLSIFDNEEILPYDAKAVRNFHQTISWVDTVLKTFKGGLRQETSPV